MERAMLRTYQLGIMGVILLLMICFLPLLLVLAPLGWLFTKLTGEDIGR